MGFTKNKGLSIAAAVIALALINILYFTLPLQHSIQFWANYAFTTFAGLLLLAVTLIFFNKPDIKNKFFGLPSISLAWIYFIVQVAFSIYCITNIAAYYASVWVCSTLAGLFAILLILTGMGVNEAKRVEESQNTKVFYIKSLDTDIKLLETTDAELSKKLEELSEAIRFSDPMTHSQLAGTESVIRQKADTLADNINDPELAAALCGDMLRLIKERNEKCKLLKNVPEPYPAKDNSGIKYAAASLGVPALVGAAALLAVFVVIPSKKYRAAAALYNDGNYAEAISAFELLGSYKDSAARADEAKNKLLDENYSLAEGLYNDQKFEDALEIYNQLNGYKNSAERIDQIKNMFAENDEIYFGKHKGSPIAWRILYTDPNKMLLITEKPVELLPFNDTVKNVTWKTSSVRNWLNKEFLGEFSEQQLNRIIIPSDSKLKDKVFLLSEKQYNKYAQNTDLAISCDWWLRTKTPAGMKFVTSGSEKVNSEGESVVRAIGVRPCLWITLN